MSWAVVQFEQLFDGSSRNGLYKSKEHHGSGVKVVNMGELFGFDRIGNQDMERVQVPDLELDRFRLQHGDLLFGRRSLVEEGAGRCAMVYHPTEELTFESSIIRVRLNQKLANPHFYFYYFRSYRGRAVIRSIVSGATVKGIRGSDLKNIGVDFPALSAQNQIVEILVSYDDLIENNQCRIKLLEEAARLLYREWFVALRFPGHERVRMTDGVPRGWERASLADIAVVNEASIASKNPPDTLLYVDIASVGTGVIHETTEYAFADAPGRARRKVVHGDTIWSCVRPNRKSFALIWEPAGNLIASTGFAVLTAKTVPFSYLHLAVTTDEFVGHLTTNATGAAYPAVSAKDFESAELLKPAQSVLDEFDQRVRPLLAQQELLKRQCKFLKQARDALLPKLMTGALAV